MKQKLLDEDKLDKALKCLYDVEEYNEKIVMAIGILETLEHTTIKLKRCKWCGKEYIPRHNRQEYCKENGDYCKTEARREQNRKARMKYYYTYGGTETIGTSNLTQHKQDNFLLEAQLIQKEKQRIGIS